MAIQYIKEGYITRSKGHNSLNAAAYRANEKLYCEREGKTYDYTKKSDCVYSEILLPDTAFIDPNLKNNHSFFDRENLWNAVEEIESLHNRRESAQLSFELKIALPKELTLEQNKKLVKNYIKDHYVDVYNSAADICIHDKKDGNPHAHVMITLREIKGQTLSKKKNRDITTTVRKVGDKFLPSKKGRNQEWEIFQNQFFKSEKIDLSVDQPYLIPTEHQGRLRSPNDYAHTKLKNNIQIKKDNANEVKDNFEIIIDAISKRQATFSQRDIENLVFKSTETKEDYDETLNKILVSDRLINLGFSESGRMTYTTKETYEKELNLAELANDLNGRINHSFSEKIIAKIASEKTLKDEQKNALSHIAKSGNIACIVGRAGAGKTYTMKAVKSLYDEKSISISGAALAGKASFGLESESGIQSNTVYQLLEYYNKGGLYHNYLPKKGSVLVIDEAGMVGLDNLHALIKMSHERDLKLILVGDPDQLQPISYGAPFRAILERVGFAELNDIQRQKNTHDRIATKHLAEGKIGLAIDHYLKEDRIILDHDDSLKIKLLSQWKSYFDNGDQSTFMLAFKNEHVTELNQLAREYLKTKGTLNESYFFDITVSGKGYKREFSTNDRIIFLKNKSFQDGMVKNGQLATIASIKNNIITVAVDGGKAFSFNANEYQDFDHGYCATIHKAQGISVDNALIYAKDKGWDRHLTYVALSRHKENMHLYADMDSYDNIHTLKRQLSSMPLRDNVLDYPLQFAIRRGEDAHMFASNAVKKIRGAFRKTKDTWNYLFNYETLKLSQLKAQHETTLKKQIDTKQAMNQDAKLVADLADINLDCGARYKAFKETYGDRWYEDNDAKADFKSIDELFSLRNQLAYQLSNRSESFITRALALNYISEDKLKSWADAYLIESCVNAFKNTVNPYEKSKLAQKIIDTKEKSQKYVSKANLWDEVNQYHAKHILRIKSGQIDDFAKRLRVIDEYLSISRSAAKYWKKSQADHFGDNKAIKLDLKGREIKPKHQQDYEYLSKAYNKKAEQLSYKIVKDFESYSQVLSVKFPHQATYEKIIDRLKSNADRYNKRETIKTYISPASSDIEREKAALKLNEDFKGYVGIGYEEGLLWGNVSKIAQHEKLRQFRANLSEYDQLLFDQLEDYKSISREAAQAFRSQKEIEESLKRSLGLSMSSMIPKDQISTELNDAKGEMYQLMAKRHEMAFNIANKFQKIYSWINEDPTQFDHVHPNLDAKKFALHIRLHEERLEAQNRVKEFKALDLKNDQQHKIAHKLAYEMSKRMGKHRFYLKCHDIKINLIYRLADEYHYAKDNLRFTGDDKKLHRAIADYMLAKDDATSAWRDIKLAKINTKNKVTTTEADGFRLSENRNRCAFEVANLLGKHLDSKAYEAFTNSKIQSKNIDITELIKFACDYQIIDDLKHYQKLYERPLEASNLAGRIVERYKKGTVYHKLLSLGIDQNTFYADAIEYRRNKYRSNLEDDQLINHDSVIEYQEKVIKVAKAYQNKDKILGNELILERDRLAYNLSENINQYYDALLFEEVNFDKLDKHAQRYLKTQKQLKINSVTDLASDYPLLNKAKTVTCIKKYVKEQRWNANRINDALLNNIENTYISIFGEPKKQTSKEMRWPSGRIVTLVGNNKGQWYDFVENKGGYPIQAIMLMKGSDYKSALQEGAYIAGLSDFEAKIEDNSQIINERNKRQTERQKLIDLEKTQRIESAQSIWKSTIPATNTLVEDYMAIHRNIYDISNTQLRFFPVGAKWIDFVEDKNNKGVYQRIEKVNKVPAMVIASTDIEGNILGVQRTYLDSQTANKNKRFDNPKLSKGSIQNGAILQKGDNGKVYIGEGIETAASIALAEPKATILVSLAVSNIGNMVEKVKSFKPSEVILLKDNDGINAKTTDTFNKAVKSFEDFGLKVTTKEPKMLERIIKEKGNQAKTDWNDIIQNKGLNGLRHDLGLPIPEHYARKFLERIENWCKIENQIPDYAKDQEQVHLLRNYTDYEHQSARYLTKAYKSSSSVEEFSQLCNLPVAEELKRKTHQAAVKLAQHDRGFRVAKNVDMHKRLAELLDIEYSDSYLLTKEEREMTKIKTKRSQTKRRGFR